VVFINIPIGLLVLLRSRILGSAERHPGQLGAVGAALGTGGMVALIYAITRFGEDGFSDPIAIATLGGAALLLVAFGFSQSRSRHPLRPLSLLRDRNRAAALSVQQVQQLRPLQAGAAWLRLPSASSSVRASHPSCCFKSRPGTLQPLEHCSAVPPHSRSPPSISKQATGNTSLRHC
jgi:hypothetical protein